MPKLPGNVFFSSRQSECLAIENKLLWWLGIRQASWKLTLLILFDWLRLGLGPGFPQVDFQKKLDSNATNWISDDSLDSEGSRSMIQCQWQPLNPKGRKTHLISYDSTTTHLDTFNLHSSPFHPVSLTRPCFNKGSSCIVFSGRWLPKSHPLRSSPLLRFVSLKVAENSQNRSAESLRNYPRSFNLSEPCQGLRQPA